MLTVSTKGDLLRLYHQVLFTFYWSYSRALDAEVIGALLPAILRTHAKDVARTIRILCCFDVLYYSLTLSLRVVAANTTYDCPHSFGVGIFCGITIIELAVRKSWITSRVPLILDSSHTACGCSRQQRRQPIATTLRS